MAFAWARAAIDDPMKIRVVGMQLSRVATYDSGMTQQGIEIERKFRLRAAPSAAVLRTVGAVAKRIDQVYLARLDDDREVAERVRRTATDDGAVTYRHTTKRRVGAFSFDEREEAMDEAAWAEALARADPARRPVRKTRHVVAHGPQVLEIDVFEEPAGLVVVEVELRDEGEAVELPVWLGEWLEVTGDSRYLNASLARRDAEIPPWE
jgi:CYTH domain-containing protein